MDPQDRGFVEGPLEGAEESPREARKVGFVTDEHDPLLAFGGDAPRQCGGVSTGGHVTKHGDGTASITQLGDDRHDLGRLHGSYEWTCHDVRRLLALFHEDLRDGTDTF